jgi:hypothetical protein
MCKPSIKSPDTSRQDAEAARQRAIEEQRYNERLLSERSMWDQQRADSERRYQGQLDQQTAESERQYSLLMGEVERQRQAQMAAEAQAEVERQAVMQQAQERAARTTQYAAGRQALVDKSTADIEGAYAGFNDQYFGDFAKSFTDYYAPQIQRDYEGKTKTEAYQRADRGTLRSTEAARSFGDLLREKTTNEATVARQGQDQANALRDSILGQKRDALSTLFATGGVGAASLPDGVTDVNSALGGLGAQLGALTQTMKNRAASISSPGYSLPANLNIGKAA